MEKNVRARKTLEKIVETKQERHRLKIFRASMKTSKLVDNSKTS